MTNPAAIHHSASLLPVLIPFVVFLACLSHFLSFGFAPYTHSRNRFSLWEAPTKRHLPVASLPSNAHRAALPSVLPPCSALSHVGPKLNCIPLRAGEIQAFMEFLYCSLIDLFSLIHLFSLILSCSLTQRIQILWAF